jgi:type IV pilus assembly protein PilY1
MRTEVLGLALLAGTVGLSVQAAAPTSAPQVLLVVTNSESMDGTTSGAIMVGSGGLASSNSTLQNSSSPKNYTVPAGFTPPLNVGSGGQAPYTVTCGSYQCDNGPSRLNLAKASIKNVINTYASTLNFGVYTYSISGIGLYTTWVYHMSPSGSGFTFTSTASTATPATTVPNPCYGYQTGSSTVLSNCSSIAGLYGASTLNSKPYLNIGATSDRPAINDVLYAPASYGIPSVFVTYGSVSPSNPYTA